MQPRTPTRPALQEVIAYYDKTQFDYKIAWLNEENLAVHFGFYDREHTHHDAALLNTNKIMASKAGVAAGMRVLDAGCGQGGSSFWLARHAGAKTMGISPVGSQISKAHAVAQRRGLSDACAFVVGDFCSVPAADESFDVVWACESLCHAADKALFYQEAARLLKPGGRLVIAEYTRRQRPFHLEAQEKLLMDWLNRWAIPDISTVAEHTAYAEAAGLQNLAAEDFTRYAFISLKNLYKISLRWSWANSLLRLLRIRSAEQYNNLRGSIKQFEALQQDLWQYSLITAQKN
ncbi:methyltransferase domain-containing protein [Phaeodactylibacter luteus]|uniref:Methyltransferase domain-containing protein n=1 Tax=Phaeodactylibacter luteus TaxID=1564516 RepID=A0A5C6S6G9_9BACT|nr:methyltransferase domain-containing protein [Phaeodactylibacter luteus]TXB69412.1 methyltransferase domain-containing protein [Phaeodactylibacter luteus]